MTKRIVLIKEGRWTQQEQVQIETELMTSEGTSPLDCLVKAKVKALDILRDNPDLTRINIFALVESVMQQPSLFA